jgi:hypothetical protein
MVFNRLNRVDNNADNGNVTTIGIGFVWGGARKTTNEPTHPPLIDFQFPPRNIAGLFHGSGDESATFVGQITNAQSGSLSFPL